ncbi:MAG: hypothetical protein IKL75_06225 [Bacteroidaceae bacterium]|nr:hypothetical protein [Bacteroidaceae bacterium]
MAYDMYDISGLPYIVRIILAAITTFAISAAIVWAMSKSRITKSLIQ